MKKMNFVLVMILLAASCQKAKTPAPTTSFNIPYNQTQALQVAPNSDVNAPTVTDAGVPLSFAPVKVATNSKAYFDKYHTGSSGIVSTYLGGMNLQITTPGTHNFDFSDALELYISSASQPEVLVAYVYNIPKGLKSINLTLVPGVNLKNYIVNDSITMRLGAHAGFIPASGAQLASSGIFQVTANPLK